MGVPGWTDRFEAGALARQRVTECQVPDPHAVIRVTYDSAPTFHYDDGRDPWILPPLEPAT